MHWQTHKGGAEHERGRADAAEPMPVAIALGGDPATIYAGSAPLPPGVDEMVFAGWLRGTGVEMVPCRTVDLEVPAEAEIVLEGWVDPAERRSRGRSATTPATTRSRATIRSSTSPRSRAGASPIYPTTIVGARRRRTTGSARPPSASSCRSSG